MAQMEAEQTAERVVTTMGKNLADIMTRQFNKGFSMGGLYWTSVMTVAIHNLYGWTSAFDKIEEEMKRIDDEMKANENGKKPDQERMADRTFALKRCICQIRGNDYYTKED